MERYEILEAMSGTEARRHRASSTKSPVRDWPGVRDLSAPCQLDPGRRIHRQARSISYRIGAAKFPVLKDIDRFAFADTPIDEGPSP